MNKGMKKNIWNFLLILLTVNACTIINKNIKVNNKNLSKEENIKDITYAFTEATKQQIFGNFTQAAFLYLQILQDNKYHAPSYYQLSRIYLYVGQKNLAINFAKKACQYDNKNYWYLINLAGLYEDSNNIDSTICILRKIEKTFPEKIDIKLQLAILLTKNKEFKKSMKILDDLEREYGNNEKIAIKKYTNYVNIGKKYLAINELRYLINQNNTNIKYLGLIAELYSDLENKDSAIFYYNKIFKIDYTNFLGRMSEIEMYKKYNDTTNVYETLSYIFLCDSLNKDKKFQFIKEVLYDSTTLSFLKGKENFFIKALEKQFPNDEFFTEIFADFYLRVNQQLNADYELRKLIEINNKNYSYWEKLLYVQSLQENLDSMLQITNRAEKIFYEVDNMNILCGIMFFQKENYNKSIEYLKKAINDEKFENNKKLEAYSFIAEDYIKLDDYSNAYEYFDKVLQIDSTNLIILNNYSYYLAIKEENLNKALFMIKKVIKNEPKNSTYIDTYAWILYKLRNYKSALKKIKIAIKIDKYNNGEIMEHYGDILFCNGKIIKAKNCWKKAIELGQNSTIIKKKINEFSCK
jgi:tetratricopeptide (TPR) repeat protein